MNDTINLSDIFSETYIIEDSSWKNIFDNISQNIVSKEREKHNSFVQELEELISKRDTLPRSEYLKEINQLKEKIKTL